MPRSPWTSPGTAQSKGKTRTMFAIGRNWKMAGRIRGICFGWQPDFKTLKSDHNDLETAVAC
jgi:hypothetical protein